MYHVPGLDLSLKKTRVVAARQNNIFFSVAFDSKSHAMILWRVMTVELNIGKKITGLEIMTLNCKKM